MSVQAFSFFCSYYTKTIEGVMIYTVKNYNPFKFKIMKMRKSMKNETVYETLKSYFN